MLIGLAVFLDGGHVNAALVRERAFPDIGLMVPVSFVDQLIHKCGEFLQPSHVFVGDAVHPHFQFEIGNDGHQVAVAAAFAVPVDGALHLPGPGFDGGQCIGDAQFGIVVGVDAERGLADLAHFFENGFDLPGQGSAVGVAQHQPVGPRRFGFLEHLEGVFRILFIPVEKMFGVEHHFLGIFFQESQAVGHHAQVFVEVGRQGFFDMHVPAFAKDGDHRGFRLQQMFQVGIVVRLVFRRASTAKGHQAGLLEGGRLHLGEKFHVFGIGPRPAAFDVVDAVVVQLVGDANFVLHRKGDFFRLGPVS